MALFSCDSPTDAEADYWNQFPTDDVRITGTVHFAAFLAPSTLSDLLPGIVRPVLVVTNSGADTASLRYGGCSFGVRLYEFASLLGTPVWQTRISDCDLIGYAVSILPRHTTTVQIPRAILTTFLADSLPAGRYYAAVTWRPSLAARVQLIPAGPVVISKTR